MVSVTAFEKVPLDQLLSFGPRANRSQPADNQLNLFDDYPDSSDCVPTTPVIRSDGA
jgi:hypothetical protein